MEKQKKSAMIRFPLILLAVSAIMLCAVPCGAYDDGILTVGPTDIVNLGTDYAPDYVGVDNGWADVEGTLNMYSGAYVAYGIYAYPGSEVNIYDSAIDNGFLTILYGADVANVTVYGPKFEIGTTIYTPPQDVEIIDDVLNVLSEDGTQVLFSLLIYSSTEIHLRAITQDQDPEQLLEELSLYILDQVDQHKKPVPLDIELRGIAPKLETSLLSKVNAALAALEKGNPNNTKVVMNNMKALVNQVSAQTNKKVSEDASEVIIGCATAVVDALESL